MDASHILLHCGGLPASRKLPPKAGDFCRRTNSKTKLSASFVVSVMPQLKSTITGAPETPATTKPAMTVYCDNWFDRLAIHHLIRAIQTTAGSTSNKKGYEGFIEEAIMVSRKYGTKKQQDLAIKTLEKAFPPLILKMAKYFLTPSKFSREFLAKVTAVGFSWLVGRCEVKESQFEGRKEKNTVYIHKCRFLESTSCVATCRNICKIPTQKFIHDSLGMPVNMVPKFEDMSCEIIFGQHPPEDDPALKHPCYQTCKAKQTHGS